MRAGNDCPEYDAENPEASDMTIALRRDPEGQYVSRVKGLRFRGELFSRINFGFIWGEGLAIREVHAGSAAESAGLQPGDVITRVDDGPATRGSPERAKVGRDFGDLVPFEVRRGEQTLRLEIPIGVRAPE